MRALHAFGNLSAHRAVSGIALLQGIGSNLGQK